MNRLVPLTLAAAALSSQATNAQELFSESFDSVATAKVTARADPDTRITYVDYSNFTVGRTTHTIPEAPNTVDGSLPTRGVLMQANLSAGAGQLVNLFAADAPDGNPVEFTGNHKLSFDVYLSVGDPIPSGGTEVAIYGISADPSIRYGRVNRNDGTLVGNWGFISTEYGIGASTGDANIYVGPSLIESFESNPGAQPQQFAEAFAFGTPQPNAPNGIWVHVELATINENVTVKFNGVTFFPKDPGLPVLGDLPDGFAFLGYEDPFGSISGAPDYQWGLFDNMVVEVAFEPTILAIRENAFSATSDTTPTVSTYQIENRNTTPLTISDTSSITGQDAADFSITTPLPIVVAPGGTAELEVTWTPGGTSGTKLATLDIVSDDPTEPSLKFSLAATFAPVVLGHYPLDETEGGTAVDASGGGFDGRYDERDPIAYAQPPLASGTSVEITEATFAPTGGNLIILPVFHTPSVSLSAWINPAADNTAGDVIFNRNPSFADADGLYGLHLNDFGELIFTIGNDDILVSPTDAILDGTAYHVAVTHLDEDGFDNDTATRSRLYINGVLVDEVTGFDAFGFGDYPPGSSAPQLFVGTRAGAGSGFTGLIDDIQVYSVELTPEQIANAFANPGTLALDPPPANAPLVITAVSRDSVLGDITITFSSTDGQTYAVQTSTDLATWNDDGPDSIQATGNSTTTVVSGLTAPTLYLRVVQE